jgi:hypothetical protein
MNHQERALRHPVRPRVIWAGVALVLVGMAGVGLGMTLVGWWATVLGGLACLLGLVVAARGGLQHDMRRRHAARQEVEATRRGSVEEGVSPHDQDGGPRARSHAAELTRAKQTRLARASHQTAAPLLPAATLVLLVLGAWLLLGVFVLGYPYTVVGQNNELRALGFSIVLMLATLWLRHVGSSLPAALLCLGVGVLVLLDGIFLPHASARVAGNEVVVGTLVIAGAAVTVWVTVRERRQQRVG